MICFYGTIHLSEVIGGAARVAGEVLFAEAPTEATAGLCESCIQEVVRDFLRRAGRQRLRRAEEGQHREPGRARRRVAERPIKSACRGRASGESAY